MRHVLLDLARDTKLIPGVYNYCDRWCERCPVTQRCLAYRWSATQEQDDDPPAATAKTLQEAISLLRDVASAAGIAREELDAEMTCSSVGEQLDLDDPLEKLGRDYAFQAFQFLKTAIPAGRRPLAGAFEPSPEEVLGRFHLLIASKVFRAVASRARMTEELDLADDANGSAKVALIAIERSRKALMRLTPMGHGETVATLLSLLESLDRGLRERFPHAHEFIRPGLDEGSA